MITVAIVIVGWVSLLLLHVKWMLLVMLMVEHVRVSLPWSQYL